MKSLILMFMFCSSTFNVFAQNKGKVIPDTVRAEAQTEVQPLKQEPIVVEKSTEEKLQEALSTIEEQKKHLLKLKDIETKYNLVVREKESIEKKKTEAEQHALSVEKRLISMASNFLYVPYEAYGVEEIAVKAFETVQNPKLKQEYNQRYVLLKNYQNHLREFKSYLERVQKACKGPFQATATEFIDATNPSVSSDLVLKKQPFYLEYIKYSDYKETFIGKLIQKTEAILKSHTKQNRANLQGVIKSIESTQSPAEIDSVEKVISTIDERLKTIEDL